MPPDPTLTPTPAAALLERLDAIQQRVTVLADALDVPGSMTPGLPLLARYVADLAAIVRQLAEQHAATVRRQDRHEGDYPGCIGSDG